MFENNSEHGRQVLRRKQSSICAGDPEESTSPTIPTCSQKQNDEPSLLLKQNSMTPGIFPVTATGNLTAERFFPNMSQRHTSTIQRNFRHLKAKLPLFLFLLTGTSVALSSQQVAQMGIADQSVQILALTKFTSSVVVNYASRKQRTSSSLSAQSFQSKLTMLYMGLLDVLGYSCFAAGLPLCGAALCTVIGAATNQLITAFLCWAVLDKKPSHGQLIALALICCGVLLRLLALPEAEVDGWHIAAGVGFTLLSASFFSILNILPSMQCSFEHLLRTANPPPSPRDVTLVTSWVGLTCNGIYFLGACYPHWNTLVVQHASANGVKLPLAIAAIFQFAFLYSFHSWAQGVVMKNEGAMGVGLVNVVRGSTVTLVSSAIFCQAGLSMGCFTGSNLGSAAIVTLGGVIWVCSGQPPQPLSESALKFAQRASVKLRRSLSFK